MNRLITIAALCVVTACVPGGVRAQVPACERALLDKLSADGIDATLGAFRRAGEAPPADKVERIGAGLLAAGRVRNAITVLRFNATARPVLPAVHRSLAAAYEANGQLLWARAGYARADDRQGLERVAAELAKRERIIGDDAAFALRALDLDRGYCVADIGCRTGWLSAAMAKGQDPTRNPAGRPTGALRRPAGRRLHRTASD